MNFGLRTRLIGIIVLAMLVSFAISAIAARLTMSRDLSNLGQQQVTSGSTGFAGYWDAKRDQVRLLVQQVALDSSVRRALSAHDTRTLSQQLTDVARQGGLAWLTVVDVSGKVVARSNGGPLGQKHGSPFVQRALSGETVSTAAKLPAAELAPEQLGPQVDAKLSNAPADASTVNDGLGLVAAVPVSDQNERTTGAVYGGVLMNHYYDVVDQATRALGGKAAVLLGDAVIASSISKSDGTRLVDAYAPVGAKVGGDKPYVGTDSEGGLEYLVRIEPVKNDQNETIGARWYGVPMSVFNDIQNHTLMSLLLWGLVGVAIALALAIPVAEQVSRQLIKRSKQVRSSAKELSVIIVGSEVSGDHVKQTKATVEKAGEILMSMASDGTSPGGSVLTQTGVSEKILTLSSLNAEILGDVVVIETLSEEMGNRMQQAVARVNELNDVAAGLDELVTGTKS